MDSRKTVYHETGFILIGQLIGVPLMLLCFYLAGYLDRAVILGGIAGGVIALANFFFMALSACSAADKAAAQDVKGGQATVSLSLMVRQILLFAALVVCAKFGKMNPLALVIPLVLVRPTITIAEFFRKKGGSQA